MSADTNRVVAWVCEVLRGDVTLMSLVGGVYDGDAPPGVAYPFVQVAEAGNSTVRGVGGWRVMVNDLVLVKVVSETRSFDDVEPAADRIDALLDGARDRTSDMLLLDCGRESEHRAAYVEDRTPYRELGGFYRIHARGT